MTSSFFFSRKKGHSVAAGVENTANYHMVTHGYQTVGKGLPTSAEILASSPSEHQSEPQLAWRPLFLE